MVKQPVALEPDLRANLTVGHLMKCFVIMPFLSSFDAIFAAVRDAACNTVHESSFVCYWLKDVSAAGRITDDIIRGLSDAAFCISDVSGQNPNVMWETGYAMALSKPTILIGQDLNSIPFDLRSHRVLEYSPDSLAEFQPRLVKAIKDTLARYELCSAVSAESPAYPTARRMTIAVTGTMNANESAVSRRIHATLAPYLSENTHWLVGTFGTVDVATIRFLLDQRQNVTAIGYHRFDCAAELRPQIHQGNLKFLDASVEAIPRGIQGPTSRDIIFCIKSDLVVLFWDGLSEGTKDLVRYYQEQGVSSLVAFI